ncbi:MAG: DUF2479 domain-containing protein [Ruminococcaceae bacterium]|nr:DUF2479 domain-containing protein [Oscillospiraceae bacterium]
MRVIEYKVRVDVKGPHTLYNDVVFTTGDVQAYGLRFLFYEDGKPYDTDGCRLVIKGKRADDVILVDQGIIDTDGTGFYEVAESLYAVEGTLSMEVALTTDEGTYITTKELMFDVRKGYGDGDMAGEDESPLLTRLICAAESAESAGNRCELLSEECVPAEQERVTAETCRIQSELERNSAEEARAAAELQRVQSEEVRQAETADMMNRGEASIQQANQAAEQANISAERAETAAAEINNKADALEILTETGKVFSITDSANKNLSRLQVYGESTQDGTPTTDAPVAVSSVENPTVQVNGKNLVYKEIINGSIDENGKIITSGNGNYKLIVAKVSGISKISMQGARNYAYMEGWFIDEPDIGVQTYNGSRETTNVSEGFVNRTVPEGVKYVAYRVSYRAQGQIEVGERATEYEPFIEPQSVTVSGITLRGIQNTVGDWIARDEIFLNGKEGYVKHIQRIDQSIEECTTESIADKTQYVLGTPIETDITDTEAGQALLALHSNYPSTTILCDTDCSVTYKADTTIAYNNIKSELDTLKQAIISLGGTI